MISPNAQRNVSFLLLLLASLTAPSTGVTQADSLAVNYVIASERLHTSGQPDSTQLSALADQGFELVINLAPPTSRNAVATEGQLVTATGASYLNIPVDWQNPTYADFELFSGILNQAGDRQVLIHCMLNYRASLFTFLYRVVHQQVPAEAAYEAVKQVWEPEDQWLRFADMVLERHDVDFDLM